MPPQRARRRKAVRINKSLVVVDQVVTTGVLETVLSTATFPCTVYGLWWEFGFVNLAAAADFWHWWIYIKRDGASTMVPNTADGDSFLQPEENVIVWGIEQTPLAAAGSASVPLYKITGHTKVGRKLQVGDRLVFASLAILANQVDLRGIVQFFCRL